MKKFLSFLLVLALGLVFVGCGDETVKPTKIEISGENEVEVGKTINLVATVTPADATDKSVEWSSSDNATATVDKGAVKGVKEGWSILFLSNEEYVIEPGIVCKSDIISKIPESVKSKEPGITYYSTDGSVLF